MLDIFDILGPVMVGPSSSHTAGAVRIGSMARTLLGDEPVEARIHLHGSFAETGPGHGTDRALVAGLEMRLYPGWGHVGQPCGHPARVAVFVHQQGAHTLGKVGVGAAA